MLEHVKVLVPRKLPLEDWEVKERKEIPTLKIRRQLKDRQLGDWNIQEWPEALRQKTRKPRRRCGSDGKRDGHIG